MRIGSHIVKLDSMGSVGKHFLLGKSFDYRFARPTRQTVGLEGVGRGGHLLHEALVAGSGYDGGSFGNVTPNPARMIVMKMRGNQISNGLAGYRLLDLGHHSLRALIALGGLDDQQIIVENDK